MGQPKHVREVTPLPVSGARATGTSGSTPSIPQAGLFARTVPPARLPPLPLPRRPPMPTTPSVETPPSNDESMDVCESELLAEAPARPKDLVLSSTEYNAMVLDIAQKVFAAFKADPNAWAPAIMTPATAVVLVQVILGNREYRKLFMVEIANAIKNDEEWANALVDRGIDRRKKTLQQLEQEMSDGFRTVAEGTKEACIARVNSFTETARKELEPLKSGMQNCIMQFDEARADLKTAEEARQLGQTIINQIQEKSAELEQATSNAATVISRIETERQLTERARDAAIKNIADAEQRLAEREKRLAEQDATLKRATDALHKALDKKPSVVHTNGSGSPLWPILALLLIAVVGILGAMQLGWINSTGKTSSQQRETDVRTDVIPAAPAAPVQTPPPAKPLVTSQPAAPALAAFPPDPDAVGLDAPDIQKDDRCIRALTSGVRQDGDRWSRTKDGTTWTCRVFNEGAISSTISQLCDCEKGPAVP